MPLEARRARERFRHSELKVQRLPEFKKPKEAESKLATERAQAGKTIERPAQWKGGAATGEERAAFSETVLSLLLGLESVARSSMRKSI
jgi:hypothetical protein